nr:hypothetical protein [uncultured Campylobacter sp.]
MILDLSAEAVKFYKFNPKSRTCYVKFDVAGGVFGVRRLNLSVAAPL